MKKRKDELTVSQEQILELEVVDFTDLEQLEESIAPVFLLSVAVGGSCSGGAGSGCKCVVPQT
jgi:hypothetical protein